MEPRNRPGQLSRRTFLLLAAGFAGATAACGTSAPAPSATKDPTAQAPSPSTGAPPAAAAATKGPLQQVKLTIPALSATTIQYYLASDQGLFAKRGLEAEITVSPASTGLKAMIAGDFDFSGSIGTTVSAALSGVPVRAVMVNIDKPLSWLYTRPNLKSLTDLKGKTIAVSSPGGVDELNVRVILQDAGMNPDTDVVFINMGSPEQRLPPLIAGSVDGAVLALPGNVLAKQAGMNELAFVGAKIRTAFGGLGTTVKTMTQRRDLVKATLGAVMEAIDFFNTHPVEAKAALVQKLNLDAKLVDGVYDSVKQAWTPDGTEAPDVQKVDITTQATILKVSPDVDPNSIFDFSIVREAVAEMKKG